MTNLEWLRKRLELPLYLGPSPGVWERALARTDEFLNPERVAYVVKLLRSRLLMGTHRYEDTDPRTWPQRVADGDEPSYMDKLIDKVKEYRRRKNRELLIDVINYAWLEFFEPCETDTYYKGEDRLEDF